MQKLNHENVVKLITTEIVEETLGVALVMEYADGNLQDSINITPNGMPSDEFRRISRSLLSAIEYLRKEDIIHRDIKPMNILTFVSDATIYKLCDFGEARYLKPNESYSSLHGTEEYVHPDIFGKFHEKELDIMLPTLAFTDTHELWSLGVTLFHIASGKLPFKPIKGRKDAKTLFKMTTGKKPGDISATQTEDGQITWSSQLPDCSLDVELKQAVTPFLAGLMQTDENTWSWKQLSEEASKILA